MNTLLGKNFDSFKNIVVFCGAGLSAESGVPTFRGKGGVWEKYDYSEYACQDAFDRNPAKCWDFQNQRRAMVADCEPNRAHKILVDLNERCDNLTIITQNIDGLQQLAGTKSIIELHGSLWRVRNTTTGTIHDLREPIVVDTPQFEDGSWMRPDIIWFGDSLDSEKIESAEQAVLGCDLLISIGTSGVVYPAAALPQVAHHMGAFMIEINPDRTPLSALYDVGMRDKASAALERLWGFDDWADLLV